jgi:hypothetical protein
VRYEAQQVGRSGDLNSNSCWVSICGVKGCFWNTTGQVWEPGRVRERKRVDGEAR